MKANGAIQPGLYVQPIPCTVTTWQAAATSGVDYFHPLATPKRKSQSPAQRSVQAGAQKANSYLSYQIMKTIPSLRLVLLRICTLTAALGPLAQIASTIAAPACAPSFQLLHSFGNSKEHMAQLTAAMVQGTDGALYGTTSAGGCEGATVFRLNPDGTDYKVLHKFRWNRFFQVSHCASLVQASDGALYGTTYKDYDSDYTSDFGTVFKLNPDGTGYTELHAFPSVLGPPISILLPLRGPIRLPSCRQATAPCTARLDGAAAMRSLE
jgi:uncharacterized repeat protein (TIGR03803 family)